MGGSKKICISYKEIRNHSIENKLMDQLKMDITKTDNNVPAPQTGDDGEAVSKIKQKETFGAENEPEMPDDAGWYVAVVRCNCENTIGKTLELYFRNHKIWFKYWVPMQRMVVIDKRSNKRRIKEKVLLTTYIFCHVSPDHLDTIRFRPEVYKMLTMPGHRDIYRISDKELNDYRRLVENPDLPITPCSGPLRKGQKVRITEGNMAGLEAYVQRLSGKKATIGNEIKFISGATIEIDRTFLEAIANE